MKNSYFIITLAFITACNNEPASNTIVSTSDKKEKTIKIEVQSIFDQSQLTSQVLDLCAKFQAMEGADRLQVFNQFEKILPNCPIKLTSSNEAETDVTNATQVMSINDLRDILGEPTEIRNDGMLVYELLGDGSYRVVFIPEVNGSVACRVYEGDS